MPLHDFSAQRRRVLKALGGFACLSASGCVHPISEESDPRGQPRSGDLEVRLFLGGYGIDFYESAAREYEQAHPGVKIDIKGDPRIWDQLRPRFVSGEPPGLAFPGWGMDHYALIYERQALPLDDALLTTPYGKTRGAWRETFLPEVMKMGEYEGQTYLLPHYLTLNGWWCNANLFREKGWKPPQSWNEFKALAAQIKSAGIAPLTHQGKYPYYAFQGFLLPWAISIGGIEAYRKAEALEPGAWKAAPFLESARMIDEIRKAGWFQNGANGMSHTEAQMEFLQGKAAMIPCGTWLESEMKKQLPAGFKMEFFLPPRVDGGKGDPSIVQVGVEPWLVPSLGKNPALAIDFFKYITSEAKARQFVREKGTLTAIRSGNEGNLPDTLQAPARALREAKATWSTRYAQWYKPFEDASGKAMAELLQGSVTPEKFVEKLEAEASRVRQDPNIPKHKVQ